MNLVSLLFSLRGRINRLQYWAATFGVNTAMWMAILFVAILIITGVPKGADKGQAIGAMFLVVLAALPIVGVAFWCQFALQVKRFHDRGRSWAFAMIPIVVIAPMYFLGLFAALPGFAGFLQSIMGPYMLVAMGVSVWMLIDLGCLPGVEGPNQYGDPPAGSGGGGYNGGPQPLAPVRPTRSAAASIFGAQAAMDRAIAERAAPTPAQATPQPMPARAATPAYQPASAPTPSFGRRAPR